MATRRERVVLELDDNFTSGMLRAAAATGALKRELGGLSGESVRTHSSMSDIDRDADHLGSTSRKAGNDIDRLSGRMRILADVAAILGPGLVPIGAATIPLVTTLANQLGLAAVAGGTAILAFQGVGTALKALNDYQLAPSAANFAKLQAAMEQLSPAAQDFVRHLESMRPLLDQLKSSAASGLFPGLTEGLDSLATRAPQVNQIVSRVAATMGDLATEAGKALAGPEWDSFFGSLEAEARPALMDMGHALGSVTHGFAELWQAFLPLDNQMSGGMVRLAKGFDQWATGLSGTKGFEDFLSYVRQTGPEVVDLLGSLGNMFVQIVQAAAPLGGPVLHTLTALADAVAALADSPLGSPIFTAFAALSLYNRALAVTKSSSVAAFGPKIKTNIASFGASFRGMSDELTAANAKLKVAQDEMAVTATRARDTQFAFVPSATKRKALDEYAVSQGRVKSATEEVAAAERKASAARSASLAKIGKGAAAVGALGLVASGTADKIGLANTAMMGMTGLLVGGPVGAAVGTGVGLFEDLSKATEGTATAISNANSAAKSGSLDQMNAAAQRLDQTMTSLSSHSGALDTIGGRIQNRFSGNLASKLIATGPIGDLIPDSLIAKIPGVTTGLEKAKQASQDLAKAQAAARAKQAAFAQSFGLTAAGARTATDSVRSFATQVAVMEGLLSKRASMRDFQAALDALSASVRQNGKTLDITTQKGRDNQAALDNIASTALKVAQNLKGMNRLRFLQGARKDFIGAAKDAGMTAAAAKRLADRLIGLNQIKPTPKIDVKDTGAKNKIKAMNEALGRFNHRKDSSTLDADGKPAKNILARIRQDLNHYNNQKFSSKLDADGKPARSSVSAVSGLLHQFGRMVARASLQAQNDTGSGVSAAQRALNSFSGQVATAFVRIKRLFADGGYTGDGSKYTPAGIVHAGEFVIPAEQTRRIGIGNLYGLMDAYSRGYERGGYVGRLPGYAAGGLVKTPSVAQINVDGTGVFSVTLDDVDNAKSIAKLSHQTTVEQHTARVAELQALGQVKQLYSQLHRRKKPVRGAQRTMVTAELAQARDELAAIASNAEGATAAIQAAQDARDTLTGQLNLFAGTGSATSAVNRVTRLINDIGTYGTLVGRLKAAGASPGVLAQVVGEANTGDFSGAIHLSQALLAQPDVLGQLNAAMAQLNQVAAQTVAVTQNPQFSSSAAWTPPAVSSVNIDVSADPSSWLSEMKRQVTFEVATQLATASGGH